MRIMLRTYRYAEKRCEGEGIRIGVTRYPPRGVRKEDYAAGDYMDAWLPSVAPSKELIAEFRKTGDSESFRKKYLKEISGDLEKRQTVELLAELAKRTPISIGCGCEDESRCHRVLLKGLIEKAAG